MRKNQKNDSNYESNSRRNNQASPRRYSGREHSFDTDSDLYENEDYYRNESLRRPRSDYDYEQSDRPRFESFHEPEGRGHMESHGGQFSETRNSRDYSGNFPSSELSGSGRRDSGYGSSSTQGAHVGKGPKGYQRSEERIREDVCDALEAHSHIDATDIEVEVSEGLVTLTGSVDSRQSKRIAEQAVETVRGVKDINNELQIVSSPDSLRETKSFAPAKNAKSGKKSSSNYKQ